MNPSPLDGRRAVVTGAGRGIGAAIARAFADAGARVMVVDVDPDAAARVAADINAGMRGHAGALTADVTDQAQVAEMFESAAAELGGLDTVVANVGAALEDDFESLPVNTWSWQVDTTLTGAALTAQAAIPHLVRHPGTSALVFIGSVNGLHAFGHEAYSAAKAGLVSLTQNLALRLGPRGVRVNLLAPGTIVTPAWDARSDADPGLLDRMVRHYPLGRLGAPDDVAGPCVFLCSASAAWITGAVIPVDGGLTAGNLSVLVDRRIDDGRAGEHGR